MIRGDRNIYISAHTTEAVREAIAMETGFQSLRRKKHKSRSLLIHEALVQYLRKKGHRV